MGVEGVEAVAGGYVGGGRNLSALSAAPDFDRAFIEQMIPNYQMGVLMATTAQGGNAHPDLRDLEATMVRLQSVEIHQMARWLSLGGAVNFRHRSTAVKHQLQAHGEREEPWVTSERICSDSNLTAPCALTSIPDPCGPDHEQAPGRAIARPSAEETRQEPTRAH